ncbi:hypothetical protein EW146_g2322 [Bondarzewia mesenterica]|uniref:Rap-GAP domain-containing protein n=1 Tax=Bondarzewia mesenterica TaxID=1095465 RepID=A0A4S4M2F9_9AGAM|nr:hypothetical protein EW146_g2322 [Bondarzewia mesenterica]
MSPQDADPGHRIRQRSNTNSFSPFNWRRPLSSTPAPPVTAQAQASLSLESLITSLTPPSVPSLSHARSLVAALNSEQRPSSSVRAAALLPVLTSLCSNDPPPALQAVGFDVLAAFLGTQQSSPLSLSDRLAFFSLFSASSGDMWLQDVWEPRFKALEALTKEGTEVAAIEMHLLRLLEGWIKAAFRGLLSQDGVSAAERADRERCVEVLSAFLTRTVSRIEVISRLREEDISGVLSGFARLVEGGLSMSTDGLGLSNAPSEYQSPVSTPTRMAHRRHPSSMSVALASPSGLAPAHPSRRPLDLAVTIYLDHLSSQLKHLSHPHLKTILPLLFRCLAFYSSSLPRLSLTSDQFETTDPLERRIIETLDPLLNGVYTTSCFLISKRHLLPNLGTTTGLRKSVQTSTGACRALRIYIRRTLCSRLARAYIARASTETYTPSGAPGSINLERDIMERAWAKDEVTRGDLGKVGRILHRAVDAWVGLSSEQLTGGDGSERDEVLLEVAGVLKDVFQEYDERTEMEDIEQEETNVVGEILNALTNYVLPLKYQDGTPLIMPLSHSKDAPTPFLRTLCYLLDRDHAKTPSNPLLSTILLSISDHLVDSDTAKLITIMFEREDLSPINFDWISNWNRILCNTSFCTPKRPRTRLVVLESLQAAVAFVKDVPKHRQLLVNLVLESWRKLKVDKGDMDGGEIVWNILADEVVLRTIEDQDIGSGDISAPAHASEGLFIEQALDLMIRVATEGDDTEGETTPVSHTAHSSISVPSTVTPSAAVSPTLSRGQSEFLAPQKETTMPFSLFSFSTPHVARSTSQTPQQLLDDTSSVNVAPPPAPETPALSGAVGAIVALLHIFSQLAFTPYALQEHSRELGVTVFSILIDQLSQAKSSRARLTVLQFFFRLRVDRDHRLFSLYKRYDRLGHIATLAGLIGRVEVPSPAGAEAEHTPSAEDPLADVHDILKARARAPERGGRRWSRGRDPKPSRSGSSRSRSRVIGPSKLPPGPPQETKVRTPIWRVPESLPFSVPESDTPSDGLISYDPEGPGNRLVLPISTFLRAIITIIETEKDWEILSYVLCHLPTLLANKHLFCGPKSRGAIRDLLTTLCTGISTGSFATSVTYWPPGLKPRDAQGLAYHMLSVLISYRKCYDPSLQHILVEVLIGGLSGQQSTIKCCLHALSLSAFELPNSIKRFLTEILQKLSQIMTNATIAVHIIDFLAIVGSLPPLYANFIEDDFRLVFGVALQYLRLHNRPEPSAETSWALSQHVRIMSYYILYSWFLAVKLPDRPRHVKYITRQLLLANEGQDEVDEPAEVCFDWLARYTYGSGDPRPADSMLSDIVMNPSALRPPSEVISEKTWIIGNALITIRALAKIGWIEAVARRPSGLTKILARIENVPMVGPGEVDPDIISAPAVLAMDRDPTLDEDDLYQEVLKTLYPPVTDSVPEQDRPDPITGYVWQGTAPSQRRKDVAIDPAYFALQLSPYPDDYSKRQSKVVNPSELPALFRTLDRMPVIDTHKVGIMYVAPGQTHEIDILSNTHGSPAYARFLEGLGRLIHLRGQKDVYAGGLDPDEDGEYAYAWWDDIGQILYHTATLMPNHKHDPQCNLKKRHIGNDFVRIIWNDSGLPYKFDTLSTQFQFVNIIIEPHSLGAIAAFSNNLHENEYFRVTVQRAEGMTSFTPVGDFKLISAENLPLLVRQLSLLADWFTSVFQFTKNDTVRMEMPTNWQSRLQAIKRFRARMPPAPPTSEQAEGIMRQESYRDFTVAF